MQKHPPYSTIAGTPSPLGATRKGTTWNFALFSQHATAVTLCLFNEHNNTPFAELPLHKTGDVWHLGLEATFQEKPPLSYGYRIDGPSGFDPAKILSDPYTRHTSSSHRFGSPLLPNLPPFLGKLIESPPFDWEGDTPPRILPEDLLIYEMHTRFFTNHSSSQVEAPGTFSGIIEKIPHLKTLGINAIELMPIFEFNECELKIHDPSTKALLKNVWGYSTIHFFSLMNRYATSCSLTEFRNLVKELHRNQIEIYLDVVYNHSAEGNATGPVLNFKGIDNAIYYLLDEKKTYANFSGTGNTLNGNHPIVSQLILDSLRYFVQETHIDGFRFDLASILTRDTTGKPLENPPLITAISSDPLLSGVKLIAEAWDAAGLYQVGTFPGGARWYEWNGKFRDTVRKFLKGTDNTSGEFAHVLMGSSDLYGKEKKPYRSINFVTVHDGYTLRDLVTYQEKHNEANGEENRDGANNNESWNCGCEGPTNDLQINLLRERQMRNLLAALLLSIGTPLLLMGDEYGHTKQGNNNTWCQDNELNQFQWDKLPQAKPWLRFYQLLIAFRKKSPLLRRSQFVKETEVEWHGIEPGKPNWGPENRFLAYTLKAENGEDLYIAFLAHFEETLIYLPPTPQEKKWYRIMDSGLASPDDFLEDPLSASPLKPAYTLLPHSAFMAVLKNTTL